MDALVNYGSDDESSDKYLENKGARIDEMKTSGRMLSDTVEDVNYDNVQMDMSEDSDGGQRPRAGRSSSSCPSSSSEGEDEPLHVRPRAATSSQEGKRWDGGRHRKKDEGRRSPGQKEKRRRKEKGVRSKDRPEKCKESKEKERDRGKSSKERGEAKEVHKRSRSRDRPRYRHHSDRRRSRSRSPHHHHRHHHKHHDDGERRSKRSRGRSSSRNHSGDEGRSAEAKKANAVSRAVAAAAANIAAAVAATEAATKNESNSELEEDGSYPASTKGSQQALLEGAGVLGETPKAAVGGLATSLLSPQLLVQRSLEVQASHLHNATGIQFPAYYNPAAMNPLKYAEQMQKRKKLWGGNKDPAKESSTVGTSSGSTNNWESTTFAQDQDGKLTAKFKRLMGIKTAGATSTPAAAVQPEATAQPSEDVIKKQEELFSTMERQYEAARLATHTLRGVGLGFGSSSTYQYPR